MLVPMPQQSLLLIRCVAGCLYPGSKFMVIAMEAVVICTFLLVVHFPLYMCIYICVCQGGKY